MAGRFSGSQNAIVTIGAHAAYLSMVNAYRRYPCRCAMTRDAYVCCTDVLNMLSSGMNAIVATHAVIDGHLMIKRRRQPTIRSMTNRTFRRGGDMNRRLTGCSLIVMTK